MWVTAQRKPYPTTDQPWEGKRCVGNRRCQPPNQPGHSAPISHAPVQPTAKPRRNRLPESRLQQGKIEPKNNLAIINPTSGPKPEPTVEPPRPTLPRLITREQLSRPIRTHEINDQRKHRTPEATPLLTPVNEQPPQKVRPENPRTSGRHVPAEHHKPDRNIRRIDGPVPRLTFRRRSGLFQRSGHRGDKPFLTGVHAQGAHSVAVLLGDLDQSYGCHLVAPSTCGLVRSTAWFPIGGPRSP